ncbi:hypothetical protein JCM10914A_13530 [Paenibacillus sp. JCM 10914]|nr:hypothetical protein [Paenibacillus sp. JCM 10914]
MQTIGHFYSDAFIALDIFRMNRCTFLAASRKARRTASFYMEAAF